MPKAPEQQQVKDSISWPVSWPAQIDWAVSIQKILFYYFWLVDWLLKQIMWHLITASTLRRLLKMQNFSTRIYSTVFLNPWSVVNIVRATDLCQHGFVMQMPEISLLIHESCHCLDSSDTSKASGPGGFPSRQSFLALRSHPVWTEKSQCNTCP